MSEASALLMNATAAQAPESPTRKRLDPGPEVTSTPAVRGRSSLLFTSTHYERDMRMAQIGEDMKHRFAGSMPPGVFLKEFLPQVKDVALPWNAEARQRLEAVYTPPQGTKLKEVNMYNSMIDALERFCPNLRLLNTAHHFDQVTRGLEPDLVKPDLTVYSKENLPTHRTDISKAEMIFEFKLGADDDGFLDRKNQNEEPNDAPFEHMSKKARDTRNQLASYVTAQLATQFRTFVFSVLIIRDHARLIRWDRSGAIVTEAFHYAKTQYLAEFLWRYNHASLEDRGVDTTVTTLELGDAPVVQQARAKLQLKEGEDVLKFEVKDDKTGKISYYFGGRPYFNTTASPTGRCTRGIVVLDEKGEPAFLKDTWRIDFRHMTKEGEIYAKLYRSNVPNIPTILACGDVPGKHQGTRTHKHRKHAHWRARFQPHQHYRLVFREVGRDLMSFETVWEVVNAMADAIEAHKVAYEKAKILHRDISVGNILITHDGKGLLIDWEFSKAEDDLKPQRAERIGTWQFMAARILHSKKPLPHLLVDDLESFYHVLSWIALRFTPHNLSSTQLTTLLTQIFDYAIFDPQAGISQGGVYKMRTMRAHEMKLEARFPGGILKDLIVLLENLYRLRYIPPLTEEERQVFQQLREFANALEDLALLTQSPVCIYDSGLEALKSSDWMLEQFRAAAKLKDRLQTTRVVHQLVKLEESEIKKRKTNVTQLDDLSGRPRQQLKTSPTQKVPVTKAEAESQNLGAQDRQNKDVSGMDFPRPDTLPAEATKAEAESRNLVAQDQQDKDDVFGTDLPRPDTLPADEEWTYEDRCDLLSKEKVITEVLNPETFDAVDIDEGYGTMQDWAEEELNYESEYEDMPME